MSQNSKAAADKRRDSLGATAMVDRVDPHIWVCTTKHQINGKSNELIGSPFWDVLRPFSFRSNLPSRFQWQWPSRSERKKRPQRSPNWMDLTIPQAKKRVMLQNRWVVSIAVMGRIWSFNLCYTFGEGHWFLNSSPVCWFFGSLGIAVKFNLDTLDADRWWDRWAGTVNSKYHFWILKDVAWSIYKLLW